MIDPVVLVVMPGWEDSEQAKGAIERMRRLGITVYHGVDALLAGVDCDNSIFKSERRFWKKGKREYPHPKSPSGK